MKTPQEILEKFEQSALGLEYGTVTLRHVIRQGNHRYVLAREESCIPLDEPTDEQSAGETKEKR